jgi:hypothetical protein
MQQVITQSQAKAVLGGRTPLMPIEYETAVKALAECITLDEAKYWDNKADALAAWAKIYHSPDAERKAKQLKLHAYRRMGQLAQELRPSKSNGGRNGTAPGPVSLLVESGLSRQNAVAARRLAILPKDALSRELERPRPRSPTTFSHQSATTGSPADWVAVRTSLASARSCVRRHNPRELAAQLDGKVAATARQVALALIEWLDEFEQHLPK